jgi:hypothetical protein
LRVYHHTRIWPQSGGDWSLKQREGAMGKEGTKIGAQNGQNQRLGGVYSSAARGC